MIFNNYILNPLQILQKQGPGITGKDEAWFLYQHLSQPEFPAIPSIMWLHHSPCVTMYAAIPVKC